MVAAVTSLFTRDGDVVTPTSLSTGPWAPDSLHGGPVAALLAGALEKVEPPRSKSGGREAHAMFPARTTLELWRPVGHEPMTIETSVLRPGRRARVLEARLHRNPDRPPSSETMVARATLQQIRTAAVELPADVKDGAVEAPSSPESLERWSGQLADEGPGFHNAAVEHRVSAGRFEELGPATDWMRVVVDLFPGEPLSPLQRAVSVADFGNGLSSVLPFGRYLFLNPDLSVHLWRLPVDEWVCVDAVTRVGGEGVGLAEAALYDRRGRIGRSAQSLLIDQVG